MAVLFFFFKLELMAFIGIYISRKWLRLGSLCGVLCMQHHCWGGSGSWGQLPSGMWSPRVLPAGLGRSQQCRRVRAAKGEKALDHCP